MSFFRNCFVVLVGCGGTGSYFSTHLSRLFGKYGELRYTRATNILLVDGDTVSESNVKRQNFVYYDRHQPKSIILSNRLKTQDDIGRAEGWIAYANKKVLDAILQKSGSNPLIIISCVDNHQTRNRILSMLKPNPDSWEGCLQKDWLLLDSGNDLLDGWTSSLCYYHCQGFGIDMRQQDTEIRNNTAADAPVMGSSGQVVRGCGYEGSPNEFFWGNQQNAMLLGGNLRSICLYGKGYGIIGWERPDFTSDAWITQGYQTHFLQPYEIS